MKTIEIHSLEQTNEFAQKIAACLKDKQMVITLDGDLGAGKTTWTKALGKALGVKSVINSPTFTILKSYKQGNGQPLHHIDAYRLEGASQDLGFEDCFDEGICVVEWSQFIEDQLPEDRLCISIEEGIDENRIITMEATGPNSQQVLEEYHD
ncbi:tRNA (adenosine(37)-N6)-threonylcarbamoyltransferase complex ATPase subunit type 1 TsaE [Floccifex sp.]|uniref:tRNA (adenosine(37)-N6)-threonylcarbamoyltransferase complex ATPase subunit type 1 TsaE n=1 Tax=Floccifex sp. TaxID=2815810 RepID=UPI002A758193|nr:tRNA (adenosine(37)-N6)-threonylcarbamoyltransferase complex ATPase subunit type 1 TsaE [Floccifex sp.]MDD7280506.1 tRNA (adenosine(37)-N6)-threonylcarbamoyltransferase complex ATPase subunit type 1 TsaE [Erysipelotrichaceae bacterium]MDY2958540.1 tRNA (adenosine(37)-N6)-threonylcarbamoyltransferase complex ATPase subunit type 1 TsaE [Floccifex sp.]